ncbi:MAG: hypothetical protein R3E39_09595 [Anaerolineae bacterium]
MRRRIILTAKLLIVALCVLFLNWWNSFSYIQPYLPEGSIPIAEKLIKAPQPLPTWLHVNPSPGSLITNGGEISITIGFCTKPFIDSRCHEDFIVESDSYSELIPWKQWTRIIINERLAPTSFGWGMTGTASDALLIYTFKPELASGLHLFQIQVARSADELRNPDPDLSYEWAYRVE